jgi:signal peptidase
MRILASSTVWLRRIIDIALIALIVVVLSGVALGKLVPLTGRQTIVIGGGSMSPAIPLGAAVIIAPVAPAALGFGDVVSLRIAEENATFTHRITDVVDRPDGRWFRTKGDANPAPDPTLVPASAVIGRVELAIPAMGYLIALLSLPVGVLFVVGLAATLLAIAWLLESLEPAPIAPRVPTLAAGGAAATTQPAAPRRGPVPAWFVAGEPIASHRRTLVAIGVPKGAEPRWAGPVLMPVIGPASLRLVARGTRTSLMPDFGALPRPTAPEQIARSREVRQRRWRFGSGGRRPGA